MFGEQTLDRGQVRIGAFHDIVSRAAVNVNVDQAGREDRVAEVDDLSVGGNRNVCAPAGSRDNTVFDHEHSVVDPLQWSQQLPG